MGNIKNLLSKSIEIFKNIKLLSYQFISDEVNEDENCDYDHATFVRKQIEKGKEIYS